MGEPRQLGAGTDPFFLKKTYDQKTVCLLDTVLVDSDVVQFLFFPISLYFHVPNGCAALRRASAPETKAEGFLKPLK